MWFTQTQPLRGCRLYVCDDRRVTSSQSAVAVFAALLDRSVAQIAEAASDVRWFDRRAIVRASDVWDNNTFALFRVAATRNLGEREREARSALTWMAGLGAERRRWMTEQAAIAGYHLDALLPPAKPTRPGRDYRGAVMAPRWRLDAHDVAELAADYDLAEAEVRSIRAERAGTGMVGGLSLAVRRRFPVKGAVGAGHPRLTVWLEGLADVVFDAGDRRGVHITRDADGLVIAFGAAGRIRAAAGECQVDDQAWHQSSAGRRASAVAPLGRPPKPVDDGRARRLSAEARYAATVLREAMREIRTVRYVQHADRDVLLGLCRALEGAGGAIVAAGFHPSARAGRRAFADLPRLWASRGGPQVAPWFLGSLFGGIRRDGWPNDAAPAPKAAPGPGVLVAAGWADASDSGRERPANAYAQLALPTLGDPDAPWCLRTATCPAPGVFRLHSDAFHGPGPLTRTGAPPGAYSLDFHEGALHVAASEDQAAMLG